MRETKDRNEQLVRESKRHNLNLCFKHKQRDRSENYSSHNCDYCIKENQLKELNDRYKEQKIKHNRDLHEARKLKTHIVHGVEIPDLRVSPKYGDYYYIADPLSRTLFTVREDTRKLAVKEWVNRGLVYQHTEEGKQAAILHSKAMLGIV